jgi:hypothetical protein
MKELIALSLIQIEMIMIFPITKIWFIEIAVITAQINFFKR